MRKILFMLFMLFSISGFAELANNTDREVLLKKGESKDYSSERPRTLIPITCVYADGMVQLTLLGEVGEFTLTVINQSTGEQWSVENALTLFVSEMSGIYLVQISTEDGSLYWGTYTL